MLVAAMIITFPVLQSEFSNFPGDEAFNCARGEGENLFVAAVEVSTQETGEK